MHILRQTNARVTVSNLTQGSDISGFHHYHHPIHHSTPTPYLMFEGSLMD